LIAGQAVIEPSLRRHPHCRNIWHQAGSDCASDSWPFRHGCPCPGAQAAARSTRARWRCGGWGSTWPTAPRCLRPWPPWRRLAASWATPTPASPSPSCRWSSSGVGNAPQPPRRHAHCVLHLTPSAGSVHDSVSTRADSVSARAVRSELLDSMLQLDVGVKGKAPGDETAAHIGALNSQLRVIGARRRFVCALASDGPFVSASYWGPCHTVSKHCDWPLEWLYSKTAMCTVLVVVLGWCPHRPPHVRRRLRDGAAGGGGARLRRLVRDAGGRHRRVLHDPAAGQPGVRHHHAGGPPAPSSAKP
jgi:hypothetical protein